ncbi:hypothetical protein Pmar_PMAR017726 [Perkinsus marinus ATCC 50983]|uniref:Polycystin cation channel PKD1/PKD2 domain-containing protein n=1 Tax=Perkinsus marinus (strain ATCC 50983 / TXsc) TaxID=423536 RepID=C5L3T9_PERM5|nr:hypothetical protein Pmar_PMAR017726 [Perkinsus marinus ATCC 50983]EER08668.1 hypothetical protein Pmar_PMAR017726 [Perkinsus marinus ATCC 50983]|eukprot:XP_002776852.1 hypothetical protein Pmar_PMAR017726 [Perkinsus marinus ATCC 50983]
MEYHESKAEQLQEHDMVPIDDTQFEENEQVVANRAEPEATRQSMDQDNSSEPSGTQSEGQRLLIQDSNSSEPEDRICHLPHFIDRLLLEQFEIHSNLRNHLGLDDVAEATTSDTIYSFLTDTFIPGMSGMNPADDEFVNSTMTDDGFIELSQKKPYRQATALVTYPILYIVRGPDSTGKCSDLGEFGQAYQNFFRTFYYCHLLPMSPVGNTSSQSTSNSTENSTATGQAPTVDRIAFYKDNNWIDGSASAVGTLTTFYTPVADIYTFVSVFYEISAVGHIEGSVYLNSFKDVSPVGNDLSPATPSLPLSDLWSAFWLVGMLLAIGLTLVQTGIDMFRAFHPGHLARGVGMKEYLLGMHAVHLGIPGHSNESTNKDGGGPIAAEEFAIFESLCDLFVLSTLILKLAAYLPSVGLTVPSFLGTLEFSKVALSLLSWDPHTETAQYLADLHRASQIETLADSLRTLTMVTLCVCCSRFVFFLATHPRVAILAETVRIGSDDMFHFFILFATLYSLLAFLARWVFGDSLAQFKSFNAALYTQFQMLIGEWPFDDFDGYENQGVMIFYMILFGIVMFFMVLNFFLAIVVDSFESTKQEIEE